MKKGWLADARSDLCKDCYDAIMQFLKDRYNNSGKGINTGLSFYVDEDVPVLTQEDIEDHKRKTGQIVTVDKDKVIAIGKPRKVKRKKRNVTKK